MSLAAVCVDRGRIVRKVASGVRTEGRTSFVPVPEQWFKTRLFEDASPNQVDPVGGHVTSVDRPQALTVAKDLDGNVLSFQGDFVIDISSREFGRYLFRMAGEPQPLRKKRRIIGWQLTLERVVERAFEDVLNENAPNVGVPAL